MSFRAGLSNMPKTRATKQTRTGEETNSVVASQPPSAPRSPLPAPPGPPGPCGFFSQSLSQSYSSGGARGVGGAGGARACEACRDEEWPGRDTVSTLRSRLESTQKLLDDVGEESCFQLAQGSPAAESEPPVRLADLVDSRLETGMEEGGEECGSSGSPGAFLEQSMMSPGEGGPIHEAPRIANRLLQKTVAELERSRNLNRDIKESILAGLRGLYEMVLRLTDSRCRHIAEKERAKALGERQNTLQHKLHAMKLEAINTYVQTNLDELRRAGAETVKECERTRHLVQEMRDTLRAPPPSRGAGCGAGGGGEGAGGDRVLEEVRALRAEWGRESGGGGGAAEREPGAGAAEPRAPESYARATARHAIMVESKNPTPTGDQIITTIKKGIDVIGMGVGVTGVRKCKNSRVAISLESEREKVAMGEAIEGLGDDFTVTEPRGRDPLLRLVGVVTELADARVEEALLRQNAGLLLRVPGLHCWRGAGDAGAASGGVWRRECTQPLVGVRCGGRAGPGIDGGVR